MQCAVSAIAELLVSSTYIQLNIYFDLTLQKNQQQLMSNLVQMLANDAPICIFIL